MPEPIRSPKQSRIATKARSNPYPRQATSRRDHSVEPLTRQSSLLGAIKSLVTAPLSWLSTVEIRPVDSELVQKRKDPLSERSGTPPKTKRVRRDSPDATDQRPASYSKPVKPLWDLGNGVPPARLQKERSLRDEDDFYIPSSPLAIYDRASQSIEPLDSKLSNIHIRRSTTRERSMPPPSPFARSFSRVSLTPQPTGATFGPSPKRKQRDLTAPLLNSVPPIPAFTRPPSTSLFPKPSVRQTSEGPIMSLLSQSRQSLSPVRETASMLIGSDPIVSASPSKAERTLSTLETYRTPLNRFPSQIYPEDRRPRKVHVPLPSKRFPGDEFRKPKVPDVSPYPTETSGLRKLLQRRRETGLQDVSVGKTTQDNAGETAYAVTLKGAVQKEEANIEVVPEFLPTATEASARNPKLEGYSSLRAPTMRLRRPHASAPQLRKPRNKFSLKEDGDETSLNLNELKSYEATIKKPHLTLNRRMSETGIQTEISTKVEESIAPTPQSLPAQPRSFNDLLSQIDSLVASKTSADSQITEQKVPPATDSVAKPAAEVTWAKNPPSDLPFSLTPGGAMPHPPPKPFELPGLSSTIAPPVEPVTGSQIIPSFFSASKTEFTPPPLPANSIFTSTLDSSSTDTTATERLLKTTNASDTRLPPSPKIPVLLKQLVPLESTKVDGSSMRSVGDSSPGESEVTMTAPLVSTSTAETEKPVRPEMSMRPAVPSEAMVATKTTLSPANEATLMSNSPKPFSFTFGSSAAKETTEKALSQSTPSALSMPAVPFIFSSPSSSPNPEFSFGKPVEEVPKPPVNIFNFGSATPSLAIGGGATLTLPTSGSSTDLVNADADNQMDTNDMMEESPARDQGKKDLLASESITSNFGLNSAINDSPFSFGSAAAKPSTTPSFGFNSANSDRTSNSTSVSTGVFNFGQSKSAPAGGGFGFTNTNATAGGSGFNFSGKPSDSSSVNGFGGTLVTSVSAPPFAFGNSPFGSPKVEPPIPTGNSAPGSPSLFPQQSVAPSPSFSFAIPSSPASFMKPDSTNPPNSPSQPFQFSGSPGSQQPGAIFTLGAAADTPPRKVKGLPQRRRK